MKERYDSKGFIVDIALFIFVIIAFIVFLSAPFMAVAMLSGSEQSETDYADSYDEQIRYEQMIN